MEAAAPSSTNAPDSFSNILPGDYVGPQVCKTCHEEKFALWSKHSHSVMNQLPSKTTVLGDFSGATLNLSGASISFTTDQGNYFMTVKRGDQELRRYKVTRTVGSRFMQFYVGVEDEGYQSDGRDSFTVEHKLPFGYWFRMKRWLPVNYFDPLGPEELANGIPLVLGVDGVSVKPYAQNCMLCHNTYPYAYRLVRGDILAGFPDANLLVAMGALSQALSPYVNLEPTRESFHTLADRLQPEKALVTLGISCETCHFGGREHAINKKNIRFVPASPFIQVNAKKAERPVTSDSRNPATVMGICAQCHSANVGLFPNGAALWNSREALDMYQGACSSQIRCVDCHNPHLAGQPATAESDQRQIATCIKCHAKYSDPKEAEAHTHHPASANISCLDCHMPRYTQGLNDVVRTHRIAKPVETSMLAAGAANACNLCHLDKSVSWTLAELQSRWGWKVESKPEWAGAYGGNLDSPLGLVWLHGTNDNMRLLATQAYGRSSLGKTNLDELVNDLNDPVPVNRVFALFAVEKLWRPLTTAEYEVTDAPAERAQKIALLLKSIKN